MPRQTSQGKCSFCQKVFNKTAMKKHLETCPQRQKSPAKTAKATTVPQTTIMHLQVEGRDLPFYWMHVELPADATLKELDGFLRDTWLECCGHLSAFTIDGQLYSVMPMREFNERNMTSKLGSVITPTAKVYHEYDFGTPTGLTLKYISTREGSFKGKTPQIMARNEPPTVVCEVCGKPATQVCVNCIDEGRGWVCSEHAAEHECGEDMLLPVVNSPRVGTCGYIG